MRVRGHELARQRDASGPHSFDPWTSEALVFETLRFEALRFANCVVQFFVCSSILSALLELQACVHACVCVHALLQGTALNALRFIEAFALRLCALRLCALRLCALRLCVLRLCALRLRPCDAPVRHQMTAALAPPRNVCLSHVTPRPSPLSCFVSALTFELWRSL